MTTYTLEQSEELRKTVEREAPWLEFEKHQMVYGGVKYENTPIYSKVFPDIVMGYKTQETRLPDHYYPVFFDTTYKTGRHEIYDLEWWRERKAIGATRGFCGSFGGFNKWPGLGIEAAHV